MIGSMAWRLMHPAGAKAKTARPALTKTGGEFVIRLLAARLGDPIGVLVNSPPNCVVGRYSAIAQSDTVLGVIAAFRHLRSPNRPIDRRERRAWKAPAGLFTLPILRRTPG